MTTEGEPELASLARIETAIAVLQTTEGTISN
jgi:hypothetical protein